MKKSKPKVYRFIAEIPEHHYVPALLDRERSSAVCTTGPARSG